MFVPLLLIILHCLGVRAAPAPAPQDPTPAIQDLPTGPTTKVYTWTYPSTQTKTVTYGGANWTTYLAVTTVDGSQVVETIVAPTDVPLHPGRLGANDEEEGEVMKEERKEGGVSCAIVGPVVAAGVLIIGVVSCGRARPKGVLGVKKEDEGDGII